VAHPYTLLQTQGLVGRRGELDLLTDWAARPDAAAYWARVLSVVAIGGMGKSALTWAWFNDVAPAAMKPLAGRLWWSFYESDATFENFLTRALAYVSGRPREEVQGLPPAEREARLLAALDREPFLLVLDGLERLLIAYARPDAARLPDEGLDEQTANAVAGAFGLPSGGAPAFAGPHRLRRAADPRAGAFLGKLAGVRASRVLISTRLYPADLQGPTGQPVPGSAAVCLCGLPDGDALGLWRAFGVGGSREALLALFHTFDNYPLLIRALAGEVAQYRRAPGDFDRWRQTHPDFDPFRLPLVQVKSHVLTFALRGLDEAAAAVLRTAAAFRMPAAYDTLAALLVGPDKRFAREGDLDAVLARLEDRGLLGWDRRANRYDLHPVVRGVTWALLSDDDQQRLYQTLHHHFQAIPPADPDGVKALEDLTPAVELYHTLVGLRRYDDAWELYADRLRRPLYYRLGEYETDLQLLRAIPADADGLPRLSYRPHQTWNLLYAAMCCERTGQPRQALGLTEGAVRLNRRAGNPNELAFALIAHAMQCCDAGYLRRAAASALEGVALLETWVDPNWLGIGHRSLGRVLMLCGDVAQADEAFRAAATAYGSSPRFAHGRSVLFVLQAHLCLLRKDFSQALELDRQAAATSRSGSFRREELFATWHRGEVLTNQVLEGAGSREALLREAEACLHEALAGSRRINLMEVEPNVLLSLARWHLARGQLPQSLAHAREALALAEPCDYRLPLTNVQNFLARLSREAGDRETAGEHARAAYRLAWCDGPPFAYHWGLEEARAHLNALGLAEPTDLPPPEESE
jgi:tetratricopeptide (TPR) repeat protein